MKKVKDIVYKVLCKPLLLHSFYKYGIPYCYLSRTIVIDGKSIYCIVWYFNSNGAERGKVKYTLKNQELKRNYSNQRYLGHKMSIYFSYRQLFRLFQKNKLRKANANIA